MKILVVKPSSLGDVVHALRVMRQVKLAHPNAEIHWIIKSGLEGILESVGWIDRIFLYERHGGVASYFRLISEIRKFQYDFCFDLQGLLRSSVLAKCSRSEKVLGRADGREFSTLFYDAIGERSRQKLMHAIDRITPFLDALGITSIDENLPLEFSEAPTVQPMMKGIPDEFVLLFPESRRVEKVWPYFRELSFWIQREFSIQAIIAGNLADQNYSHCNDLRGLIPLRALPDLITRAKLVISNDSAPLHLASAGKTKLIALFGPTEPERYGPYPINRGNTSVLCSKTRKIKDIKPEIVRIKVGEFLNS